MQFGRPLTAQLCNDTVNSLTEPGSSYVYGITHCDMAASNAGSATREVEYERWVKPVSIFFSCFDVVLRKLISKIATRKAETPASLCLYAFGFFEGAEN